MTLEALLVQIVIGVSIGLLAFLVLLIWLGPRCIRWLDKRFDF